MAVRKIMSDAVKIAQKAVEKPYWMAIDAPIASNAKKEILPIAVLAIKSSDHFRNDLGA